MPSRDFFTLLHPHFKQLIAAINDSAELRFTPFFVHLLSHYSKLYLSPDD
jgi:hypothetical protein